ncbi:MAG TPA: hypothetical protein VKN14_08980 [Flavobacteriaceae bacterium]|nr:hypothetical protein [Flavobacteriaceae bacterium]
MYRFLIYISYSYALPIGNPLEKEILKRGYEIEWFSDTDDGKQALQTKDNVLDKIEDVLKYSPDIILTATDNVPDFINAVKVQIFHGFNAEKRPTRINEFKHFTIRGFFDLYCTHGPSTTVPFSKLAQKKKFFEVIETGWSKVDPLFPLEAKPKNPLPVIFIASTFTEKLSLAYNNAVFQEIERLSKTGKYHFNMVLHPKIPIEIVNKWKSLSGEYFTFYDTTNLIPLFKQADIIFADTTSAIQEFLLQIKPVVSFNHTIEHDYLLNIKDAKMIETAFDKALTYPESLLNYIKAYVNQLHPFKDGKSSKRIIDATLDFLHKDKSHLKPKPLNLIRKFKIRKKLNYFTLKSYNKAYTKTKK